VIDAKRERELALRARELDIVPDCARKLARRYAGLVNESDLESLGNETLADVVRMHQDDRSPFESYCRWRIKFVMLSSIRALARDKRIDRAAMRAQADLLSLWRGDPHDTPRERMQRMADAVTAATFAAMVEEAQRGGEGDLIAREEYATAMTVLAEVLGALPRPQQKLFVLVYVEGRSLEEAHVALGVHYNTVLRWHAQALEAVKEKLIRLDITGRPGRGGAPRVSVIGALKDRPPR
jgi:RNA polymerase sigma factor (sigma-70 family)